MGLDLAYSDSVGNGSRSSSHWVNKIPLAAAIYAIAAGLLTLIGWTFGVERLTDWNSSGITMKANAAVCVTLLGLALAFALRGRRFPPLVLALVGANLLITVLTISQYI